MCSFHLSKKELKRKLIRIFSFLIDTLSLDKVSPTYNNGIICSIKSSNPYKAAKSRCMTFIKKQFCLSFSFEWIFLHLLIACSFVNAGVHESKHFYARYLWLVLLINHQTLLRFFTSSRRLSSFQDDVANDV